MENKEQKPITAMSVKMLAVITQNGTGGIQGRLDCEYFDEPFVFASIVRMIKMMETTFDAIGFPEKHLLPRTYGKAKQRFRKHELDIHSHLKENSISRTLPEPNGNLCTFEIIVRFRHNAEWQGYVHWIEKDVTKHFSSVVELTRLIDKALTNE